MFAVNKEEFLANEKASKDTIDVKRIYIDMAGDLVGGVLLSQIVFWHLPGENGNSKLRVYHKGEYWIARGREDYWDDCRLTAKQFDRAIKELEELNLVVTDVIKFNGSPMKHVRIDWQVFLASYQNLLKSYGENGNYPKGKNQITQKVKSLTESTSETTKEVGAQPAPAPSDEKELIDFPTPAPREKTTLEDVKRRIVAAGQSGLERGGKRRGVSDPYLAAGEEQRDWAAQIASVIARQPISVGQLGDMPAAIRKDYVWKAKDVMDDITRGKVPRERYTEAFTHLLNGGGSKYEKYGATSAQVVRDAAQIASGETQEERDAKIKAARMAA